MCPTIHSTGQMYLAHENLILYSYSAQMAWQPQGHLGAMHVPMESPTPHPATTLKGGLCIYACPSLAYSIWAL